jgi:hypothetical protein
MDIFDFFKRQYYFEINRKQELLSSMAIPILILSAVGGMVGYYLNNFIYKQQILNIFFLFFILVTVFFFILASIFLTRSYLGYSYKYIPFSNELLKYFNDLQTYYKNKGTNKSMEDFENNMIEIFAHNTKKNTWNNDSKSEFFYKSMKFSICAFFSAVFCFIPFFISSNTINTQNFNNGGFKNINKIQKEENLIIDEEDQKPQPPPSREVKEGEQPRKPKE